MSMVRPASSKHARNSRNRRESLSSHPSPPPGQRPEADIRRESDPPSPVSHYGRSKLAAETAASSICGLGAHYRRASGNCVWAARYGFCAGAPSAAPLPLPSVPRPGASRHCPSFMWRIWSASSSLPRSAADIFQQTITIRRELDGISPSRPNIRRMQRSAVCCGRCSDANHAPILSIPGPLAYCVGGLNELVGRIRGRAEELCVDKIRDALVPSWACSGEAAQRDLGFVPPRPLAERFQETVDWCLAHRPLGYVPEPEPSSRHEAVG